MTKWLKSISAVPTLGLAVLFTLITIPAAFGAETIKSDVPFAFKVGSKTLPAGNYEFTIKRTDDVVMVEGSTKVKGSEAIEPIMTTLAAAPHTTSTDAHLVFDKVGSTYTLSELWEPNMEGVLLHVTKGKHEHHVIHVKK